MKSEVLANYPYLWLTIVGFFLFLLVFVGMVYWTMRRDNKKFYSNCGNIPLEDAPKINQRGV
jgi:cbb3-type cytochrome oxidase subunit 3